MVQILRDTGDAVAVLAYGAQLEKASARGFYVATTTNKGADAGRGAFGSTAATHSDGDEIREVLIYRQHLANNGVNPLTILRDLVNRGEILAADVDQSTFDAEFDFVIAAEFRRSGITTIAKPRRLAEHIKDIREQALLDLWSGEDGKIKTRLSFRTSIPGVTLQTIDDETNIKQDSSSYKNNAESRTTRVLVYHSPFTSAEASKPEDFAKVEVSVDLTVESASGPKSRVIFSKWIFRTAEARAVAGRLISRFRRGARKASWTLELKDTDDIFTGDVVQLDSVDILRESGSTAARLKTNWQITSKDESKEGEIGIEALEISGNKPAFIGPAGLPDFPAATEADKVFGFIGDANNLLDSGTVPGYVII